MTRPTEKPDMNAVSPTGTFRTPYDQHREHDGKQYQLLGEVDRTTIDYDETGPLYRIQLESGEEIEAWPDELDTARAAPAKAAGGQ